MYTKFLHSFTKIGTIIALVFFAANKVNARSVEEEIKEYDSKIVGPSGYLQITSIPAG